MAYPHKNYTNLIVFVIVLLCPIVSIAHMGHDHHDHSSSSSTEESDSKFANAHSIKLEQQVGVNLKWISEDSDSVTMKMSSKTEGYLAVGFCAIWVGSMEGCDIVLGWVDNDNGTAFLFDYYAKGNSLPLRDESQDYELIKGSQEDGITTITFKRKWSTGDDNHDANLEHNHVHVIWSWHPVDPVSPDEFLRHAIGSRGHTLKPTSFKDPTSMAGHDHQHDNLNAATAAQSISYILFPLTISIIMSYLLF